MSPKQALAVLDMAREFHEGKRSLPPEILAIKIEIEQATRKAELFVIMFRVVDEGMVNKVVDLMHQRDLLYSKWVEQETTATLH
jgi:hypothetical protein